VWTVNCVVAIVRLLRVERGRGSQSEYPPRRLPHGSCSQEVSKDSAIVSSGRLDAVPPFCTAAATRALGDIGDLGNNRVTASLIAMLSRKDSDGRLAAAHSLGRLGHRNRTAKQPSYRSPIADAASALARALDDEDAQVRALAAEGLEKLGELPTGKRQATVTARQDERSSAPSEIRTWSRTEKPLPVHRRSNRLVFELQFEYNQCHGVRRPDRLGRRGRPGRGGGADACATRG